MQAAAEATGQLLAAQAARAAEARVHLERLLLEPRTRVVAVAVAEQEEPQAVLAS